MLCPDCGFDNIQGMDDCEACGQPLATLDPSGGELEQAISRHAIGVLCPKPPLTIGPQQPVSTAIETMSQQNVGCLLVVDDNSDLIGIFTERDVLNRFSSDRNRLADPVGDFMTPTPVTVSQDDSIAYALHAMDLGGYRHLPVVDQDDRPTGIISVRDILSFLCIRFAELRSTA
jgi:CBS domain-containing protein